MNENHTEISLDFRVISLSNVIAETDIRNDAMEIWFDAVRRNREFQFLFSNDVVVVFRERKCLIPKGTEYKEYEFVDAETGEICVLNCSIDMDKVNLRNNTYPEYIKRAIVNFEINNL